MSHMSECEDVWEVHIEICKLAVEFSFGPPKHGPVQTLQPCVMTVSGVGRLLSSKGRFFLNDGFRQDWNWLYLNVRVAKLF